MAPSRERERWKPVPVMGGLLAAVLFAYCASYLALSLQGRYEATLWGLNHVKSRMWVPRGFESNGDWNTPLVVAFLPLYWLDHRFWHTPGEADSGRYPVNSDDYYMFPKLPARTTPAPREAEGPPS